MNYDHFGNYQAFFHLMTLCFMHRDKWESVFNHYAFLGIQKVVVLKWPIYWDS